MSVPVRLAVAGAAAMAVLLARRGRRRHQQAVNVHEEIHAEPKVETEPEPAVLPSPANLPPDRVRMFAAVVISLLATILATGAAVLSYTRGSADVAMIIVSAWCMIIMQKSVTINGHVQQQAEVSLAQPELEEQPVALPDLSGTWIKDMHMSDSMGPATQLLRLNGIMRTAVQLIRGVTIHLNGSQFTFGVFSVISWFKVMERYVLGGGPSSHKRRDMRRGRAVGTARATRQQTVVLDYEWQQPHAGKGTDEFELGQDGRLRVHTVLQVAGHTVRYTQVYNRKR